MVQTCQVDGPDEAMLSRAYETGKLLRQLAEELKSIFPEREDLIDQIIFALLMREHVLAYGLYGTGKSDLLRTLFGVLIGAKRFSISMNKFMKESDIIGLPNVVKMKEEGVIEYDPEGGVLDAEFAEFDEFLDANAPVQRTLLGLLNERQFKRGRQNVTAKLHTAVASTNWSPSEAAAKDEGLGAVLDRFLFQAHVFYLSDPESRMAMYQMYLDGAKPTVEIPYESLEEVSQLVTGPCQIRNPLIIETYDRVICEYRDAMKEKDDKFILSDRRACKLMKCMEANAILNGRYTVELDDIRAVALGACIAGNKEQRELFDEIANAAIEEAKAKSTTKEDAVMLLLENYEGQIPVLPIGDEATPQNLQVTYKAIHDLLTKLDEVNSDDDDVYKKKESLVEQLRALESDVLEAMKV